MRRFVFVSSLLATLICWSMPAMAQQSTALPTLPGSNQLPKFIVTVALGDIQAGQWSDFTPGAKKALDDLKGFLPYKTYKLLDTQYRVGVNGPNLALAGFDTHLTLLMAGEMTSATTTRIRLFRLTDTKPQGTGAMLVDTQFNIELGETVVVGTSKIDGSRALLVLVTCMR